MASVNKVILIGNLGRDPELRYTPGGQAVANFSLATSERFAGRDGQQQERTEWHRIVVWGKTAENCAQFLAKGRSVYVEGRLQTQEWEDKEGVKRKTTEVVAQRVQFLGGPRGGGGGSGAQDMGGAGPAPGGSDPAPGGSGPAPGGSGPPPADDIPF